MERKGNGKRLTKRLEISRRWQFRYILVLSIVTEYNRD